MKNTNHRLFLLLACIGMFILNSCGENGIFPEKCTDFRVPNRYEFVGVPKTKYSCDLFSFNPNNSNEFVAGVIDNTDTGFNRETKLAVYNLSEKRFDFIHQAVIWDSPQWGSKNWIMFEGRGQLYKIKPNGDSLTQITSTNENYHACWSPEGDKIAYMSLFSNISSGNRYLAIADANGNLIDTTFSGFSGAWGKNNLICSLKFGDLNHLLFYEYPSLKLKKEINALDFKAPSAATIDDLDWIPNSNKVVWTCSEGIFVTDYDTEKTTLIKSGCETKAYTRISISPDGKKILSNVVHSEVNRKKKQIDVFSKLYLMNIDGTGEEELIFSE